MKRSIVDIESSVGSGGARGINVGGMIAVCFYICYILGVYKVDLLFGMQELSIFLPGKDFFLESLACRVDSYSIWEIFFFSFAMNRG